MACPSCMCMKLNPRVRDQLCAQAHGTTAPRASTARTATTTPPRPPPVVAPPRPDPLDLVRTGSAAYHVVSMLAVDDEIRRSAVHAVKAAAARLGIGVPEIVWVAERGEPGWLEAQTAGRPPRVARANADGFFLPRSPNVIHVKAALPSSRHAAIVALHELGHLRQHQVGGSFERASTDERERLEQDAREFADRMMAHVGGLDDHDD